MWAVTMEEKARISGAIWKPKGLMVVERRPEAKGALRRPTRCCHGVPDLRWNSLELAGIASSARMPVQLVDLQQ